jgi:hypothetical protein
VAVTRVENKQSEFYTGVAGGPFKRRYYSNDLRHRSQRSSTCLSKYVWDLKDLDIPYNISWKIFGRGFNPTTRSCQACLKEKYFIMFRPAGDTINVRSVFIPAILFVIVIAEDSGKHPHMKQIYLFINWI